MLDGDEHQKQTALKPYRARAVGREKPPERGLVVGPRAADAGVTRSGIKHGVLAGADPVQAVVNQRRSPYP